jgi:hypothetical protein
MHDRTLHSAGSTNEFWQRELDEPKTLPQKNFEFIAPDTLQHVVGNFAAGVSSPAHSPPFIRLHMRVPVKPKPTPSAVFAVPKPAPSAVLRQAAPPLRSLNSSGNGIGSSETETDDATVIPMEDSGGIDPQPPQPSVVQPSSTLTEKPLTILCLDISRWTPGLQLFSLSMGIFFFFLINGYVEEYLFKMFPSFHFGTHFLFIFD